MSKMFSVPDVNPTSTTVMNEIFSVPDVEMKSFSAPDVKLSSQGKISKPSSLLKSKFMPVRSGEFFQQNYKKMEEIGTGGFGTVWKGLRITDSTPVAIKEIKKHNVSQWGLVHGQSVPMEAIFLMKLKRVEGVIRILDLCVQDDIYIIIMERQENSVDLFDYIYKRRRIPSGESRRVFKSVLRTLVSCRRQSVFHGDVKDENILIDVRTKKTKLIDFGGAMTWTHGPYFKFFGTGLWGPPECNKREEFYPESATVWSLGCLLHVMLSGYHPFKSKIRAISGQLDLDGSIVDRHATDLIQRCLEVPIEKRLTLDEISHHLWLNHRDSRKNKPAKAWGSEGNCQRYREEPRSAEDWLRSRMSLSYPMLDAGQESTATATAKEKTSSSSGATSDVAKREETKLEVKLEATDMQKGAESEGIKSDFSGSSSSIHSQQDAPETSQRRLR